LKRILLVLFAPILLSAQNLKEFEKRVTEFTLPNGLHFIILERHEAPVVSFHTYVNAGAVDDPSGKTGLAHMFEHMAFKGTETIGSRNWPEEKKALADVEKSYDKLDEELAKGPRADPDTVRLLRTGVRTEMERASTLVVPNMYPGIIEENGGVGLNAQTGEDSTNYFYNLPANRLELWFLLESGRFIKPVFRDFYKERDVVREERRMRTESEPQGKLIELFGATAIEAHPYRRPAVGWASDIENLRVSDAEAFFNKYYVAANITIAIVGDVKPPEIRSLAEKYFGPLPKKPLPSPVFTVEPVQEGPKRAEVESASQPIEVIGYKRPSQYDKDDLVFDVIASILSGGRTGLLYKDLVNDKQIALGAGAEATYPGGKYPNLFLFYFFPALGKTIAENEKAFYAILNSLKAKPVDNVTLQRVKTKTRAGLIRSLDSNSGLASLLANSYANYGDWRKPFTELDEIDKVTAADVQRVVTQYFTDANRTVTLTVSPNTAASAGASAK
jgi:predicted Zn-dependent peptidase